MSLARTLVWYDGPQVIELKDSIGGCYVGVAIDHEAYGFMVVGVSPNKLRQFLVGSCDLLDLLTDQVQLAGWALGNLAADGGLEIEDLRRDFPQESYLPEKGFFLFHDQEPIGDLMQQSLEKQKLVLRVTLDSPESIDHQIRTDTLGQFLVVFQRMIRHAYRTVHKPKGQDSTSQTDFTVSAFSPGSFQLLLESPPTTDLFQYSETKPAIDLILKLLNAAQDPNVAEEEVPKVKGHLVSSFISLLDVLIDSESKIGIQSAEAGSESIGTAELTVPQATATRNRLRAKVENTGESKTVRGLLKKADAPKGTWRVQDETKEYSGVSSKEDLLSNLTIDRFYAFHCTEKITQENTGKEKYLLVLDSVEEEDVLNV